jgi:hypothetical protein
MAEAFPWPPPPTSDAAGPRADAADGGTAGGATLRGVCATRDMAGAAGAGAGTGAPALSSGVPSSAKRFSISFSIVRR